MASSMDEKGSSARQDGPSLLSVVASLYGSDRPAADRLDKALRRLIGAQDWSAEVDGLERRGLSVKHLKAPLRDVLEQPGDLLILRFGSDSFALLQRKPGRWQALDGDGEPLGEEVSTGSEENVEALMMRLPVDQGPPGGIASLATLWKALRAAWAEVGVASFFINCGQLLLPIFALLIYDRIALNGLFETLWALVFGMALYLATDAGMRLIRSWATEKISLDQTLRSDDRLWSRLVAQTDLPPGGFPAFLSHYRDLTQARDFVSSSYLLAIADIPFLLLYLAVIGFISWPLMVVAAILVLVFSGAGFLLHTRQKNLSKEAEQKNTLKLSFMGETLGCLDVVRTAPGAGAFRRRWRELTEESSRLDTRRRLALQQMGMLSSSMQTVTTVVILTAGVYLIHAQMLSIGKLIACNLLANRGMALVASLYAVVGKWQDFRRAATSMETSLKPVAERRSTPRPVIEGRLSVIGVGKHYEGRPPALEEVTMTAAPGDRLGLLGRPGAGKSTLLRCLAGLSEVDAGQILVDGLALEDIARVDRVRWLAYKGQDPAVFAGTLEDNLRISECTDQARYREAIWASGLEAEFKSGRMSLGMILEERGNNLSGGQRQKVALARALAQPSRFLLLDEPTLGLDPESERLLAARLPKILDPSSVLIMTTHSPIMLEIVRRIIALDGGRVVADGPREKLVTLPSKNAPIPSKRAQSATA